MDAFDGMLICKQQQNRWTRPSNFAAMLTHCHSPNSRYLYQTVSSGRLPYHCSMNCENAV